eukprot:scaffold14619_cov123-Isochrysis_galbana.AAC.1
MAPAPGEKPRAVPNTQPASAPTRWYRSSRLHLHMCIGCLERRGVLRDHLGSAPGRESGRPRFLSLEGYHPGPNIKAQLAGRNLGQGQQCPYFSGSGGGELVVVVPTQAAGSRGAMEFLRQPPLRLRLAPRSCDGFLCAPPGSCLGYSQHAREPRRQNAVCLARRLAAGAVAADAVVLADLAAGRDEQAEEDATRNTWIESISQP